MLYYKIIHKLFYHMLFLHVKLMIYLCVIFVYKQIIIFINKLISKNFENLSFFKTMSISLNIISDTFSNISDISSNVFLIEKPKFDANRKCITNMNIALYTKVDRQIVLRLKVNIINFCIL